MDALQAQGLQSDTNIEQSLLALDGKLLEVQEMHEDLLEQALGQVEDLARDEDFDDIKPKGCVVKVFPRELEHFQCQILRLDPENYRVL